MNKRISNIVVSGWVLSCLLAGLAGSASAQLVGTGISADGALPNTNAMLDVQSPSTGDGKGLLIPRLTINQRTNASAALAGGLLNDSGDLRGGAAHGLLVYQTDGSQGLYFNTSISATPAWVNVGTNIGSGDFMANGSVPMTGNLDMDGNVLTNVTSIDFISTETAVGDRANADGQGTAVGCLANGSSGVAVGYQANG